MKERPVLPARFYGDPSEVVDELREARVLEMKAKRRRIKRLVEKVLYGKKGKRR